LNDKVSNDRKSTLEFSYFIAKWGDIANDFEGKIIAK